ncbi:MULTISPECIES: phosphoribosyltransferase [Microbacterium]|uniref:Phosphoribosyltransferase n=1 Tax=Microbacterium resistens TaxID=156977 RepID=A0ABY3RSA5_9MICO|nr:phosphoribosyltransferase family protein [Microbacterium resistens]UGS25759.1 phosphoribosyltransferase [Microbacterium resistens]
MPKVGGMTGSRRYRDRAEAGRVLAAAVRRLGHDAPLVLGLPRGGVPVAAEIAQATGGDLDVVVVRKLGFPGNPEVAMGAIASLAGRLVSVRNPEVLAHLGAGADEAFERAVALEEPELRRRERAYRGDRAPLDVRGRTLVLADDGIATGATMRAAAAVVRDRGAVRTLIAAPIALGDTPRLLHDAADDLVLPWTSDELMSVGQAYELFDQTPDEQVRALLGAVAPRA